MDTNTTVPSETKARDDLATIFRIRLPRGDVSALKDIARRESARRGVNLGWADLARAAIKKMVAGGVTT